MHPAVDYHLLRTTQDLTEFVPKWRRLFERDPFAKPFQSPEWLAPWWKHFGGEELCAATITQNGELVGWLPFYVYHDVMARRRQLLPLGVGTTDYLDGVFAPQCSAQEIGRAVQWLRSQVRHDVFCAAQLPETSRLLEAFKQGAGNRMHGTAPGSRESKIFLSKSDPCSRMTAVTIAELPQKIRRNAMYYRNRAQRRGRLELVQADESNWEEIFAELVRLHTLRWKSRGEQGVLVDERVVSWHHEAIPLILNSGLLRLMALRLENETIAVLYSLVDRNRNGRTQYFYITAYSPEHAELRPGTLLIAYAVENASREGFATIDMLRGDEEYKQIWHMQKVPTWCVTQFAESTRVESDREDAA